MTNLKNIISKSLVGIVDTLNDPRSFLRALEFAKYNSAWLEEFDTIVYSVNGEKEIVDKFLPEINNILRACTIEILYSDNLGEAFGAMDNDRKIFDYSKDKDYEYIWKFSNDVIADTSIFDVEIDESKDFFYINNIGYAAFAETTQKELISQIKDQSYFYPQTNYYIIKNKVDKWYPSYEETIDLKQQHLEAEKTKPGIRPWEAVQGCDCEHMLAKTVRDNNLQASHLLSDIETENIVNFVYTYKVGDGSHKNVIYPNIGNLCHYHVLNHPCAAILPESQTFLSEEEANKQIEQSAKKHNIDVVEERDQLKLT